MSAFYTSNQLDVQASLRVQRSVAVGAVNGTGVSIANYELPVQVLVDAPLASSGDTITFTVEHAEDNSTFTAVDASILVDDNGDPATFTQVTDAVAVFERLTLRRGLLKKYVRVVATTAGSGVDVTVGAYIIGQKASY